MADTKNPDAETQAKIEANAGQEVGDIVLYNPADSRGWVEATITRVRAAAEDIEPSVDITYPHHRTDTEALATAEKVRHGAGGYQYLRLDERPREPLAPPAATITPIGAAAEPGAGPSAREADLDAQIAGMEQMIRRVLDLEPTATGDDVKEAIEHSSAATLKRRIVELEAELAAKRGDADDDDDGSETEYLCVIEGCEKAEPGEGYKSLASLRRHANDKHDGATVLVGDGGAITFGTSVEGTVDTTVGRRGAHGPTVASSSGETPAVPTNQAPETSRSSGSGGGQPPEAQH